LWLIAENLSPNLHVSLMSQYYPPDIKVFTDPVSKKERDFRRSRAAKLSLQYGRSPANEVSGSSVSPVHPEPGRNALHRPITRKEYKSVVDAFHGLGFTRGWLQEYESHRTYRPDFSKDHPFE